MSLEIEGSVERAIKAVETILNPLASSQERASANQYCEGIKGNFGEALQLAFRFVPFGNGYPLPIRQLGLNLLEHVSKHLSLDWADGQALLEEGHLLERIWELGMGPNGLSCETEESMALKEKMGVVFVQTAVRVWPQRWPNLLDLLREEMASLGQSNGQHQSSRSLANGELALIVMRMLVEEIHAAADADVVVAWDESRRSELQAALAVVLPSFAEWLWRALPAAASNSSPTDGRSMRILGAMVKGFGAVCQWVPLVAESTPMALGTLFNILQAYQGGIREDVLEALMVFSMRHPRTGEEHLFAAIFDQELGHFEGILSAMAQASSGDDAEEAYGELKRMAEIILNLATIHLGHKKHPSVPKQLGRLYQILLGLTDLPSLVIKSLGFIFWGVLIRGSEKVTTAHPDFDPLLPALFTRLFAGMASDSKAERKMAWNRLDFDDVKEFEEVASVTVNRISGILHQLAERHPTVSLNCLRSALMSFIAEPQVGEALKSSSITSPSFITKWTALCGATEAIARGLKDESLAGELNGLLGGFLGLIEPGQSHPEIVAAWLNAVKGLAVSLGVRLEASGPLLTGLLGLAFSYKNPLRADLSKADPMEVTIKGRSSSILLKLASTSPALFLPHLDQLMTMFQAALTSTNTTQSSPNIQQRRLFTEIFLVLAAEIPDHKRIDVIEQVLRPVFEEVDAMTPWISNLEAFKRASGLEAHLSGQPGDESCATFRKSLSNLLALVFLVVTRVAPSKSQLPADASDYIRMTVLPRLHRFLFGFLGLLSQLSQPQSWPSQATWALFYDCQVEEPNVKATFESAMEESNPSLSVETLRGWLSTIQVSALVSSGLTSSLPGFYQDFDMTQSYLLAAFNPASMPLTPLTWHWKHLLGPLFVNCKSPEFLQSHAPLFDGHCFGPTFERLQREWARLEADKLDDLRSPDLAAEMQRESQLVSLSSHLINILYDILYPLGERDKKIAEPCIDLITRTIPGIPVESHVARWFMAGDLGRQAHLLRFLVESLGWRASVGWGKALLLITRWFPTVLSMNQTVSLELHSSLLPRLLRILAQPDYSDHHNASSQLFCELYKSKAFLGLPSPDSLLLSLPGLSTPSLIAYHQTLHTTAKTLKSQKEATRTLLKPWQAEAAKEFSGKAFRVGKMPEKLVLLKKLKAPVSDENDVTADDIDNLFAQS